jgi:hypothetical protein
VTTRYSIQKVRSALELVREFQAFEFPHPDSKEAATALSNILEELANVLTGSTAELDEQTRAEATLTVSDVLDLLGVITNSANVRNAFEVHGPFLALASKLLVDKDTRLILSFEWKYVPYTYPKSHPLLPNFVIIGLPASEASNALVLPAVGHELGHSLWRAKALENEFTPKINRQVLDLIKTSYRAVYEKHFDSTLVDKADELTNQHVWERPVELARMQLEEIFCDFVGLFLFGESYLDSFEYLISPTLSPERDPEYPSVRQRAKFLSDNSNKFAVTAANDFALRFSEQQFPYDSSTLEAQELMIADNVASSLVAETAAKVQSLCQQSGLSLAEDSEPSRILKEFCAAVPAEKAGSLGAILNAGWLAYKDNNFLPKTDEPVRLKFLNELVLKTIEIYEIENMVRNVPKEQ